MTYQQQLRDPRWIKRRNEIISKANNVCEHCGDDEQLEVHHGVYLKGKLAWEYKDEFLYCLCHNCHGNIQEDMEILYLEIGRRGLDLHQITGMIRSQFEPSGYRGDGPDISELLSELRKLRIISSDNGKR